MESLNWTAEDTRKAKAIWAEYQKQHDVSDRHGQAVGIDPDSGEVWFGPDARDVVQMARADGAEPRLFCIRVGFDHYQRKGGRR